MAPSRPIAKAYRGINHLTLGSDLISIIQALPIPEQLLGKERATELKQVKLDAWYPIAMLLEPLELLAQKMGDRALVPMGYSIIRVSHAEAIRKNMHSAKEVLFGFDGIYKRVNKGEDIGGWKMLSFEPGKALLENTTPHHCFLEMGIVQEALRVIGIPSVVKQTQCVREGADSCHFLVTSPVQDARWMGR